MYLVSALYNSTFAIFKGGNLIFFSKFEDYLIFEFKYKCG